jgi:hypothetical protein
MQKKKNPTNKARILMVLKSDGKELQCLLCYNERCQYSDVIKIRVERLLALLMYPEVIKIQSLN